MIMTTTTTHTNDQQPAALRRTWMPYTSDPNPHVVSILHRLVRDTCIGRGEVHPQPSLCFYGYISRKIYRASQNNRHFHPPEKAVT